MRSTIRAQNVSRADHRVITVGARRSVRLSLEELVSSAGIDLFPEVESKGYFSVQFCGKELQLTAGSFIGLIPINSRITLDVRPKLPVSNLARVIELSQLPLRPLAGIERLYARDEDTPLSILEFLAWGLLASLKDIEIHGYFKLYVSRQQNTGHPRGRIDLRQTGLINVSRGIRHKVVTHRFDQTINSPYNQLLKHALLFLAERFLRTPSRDPKLMSELNKALAGFESVSTKRSIDLVRQVDSHLRGQRIPLTRRYYERPLRIALTIVAGEGVSLVEHGEEVELSSYVVNFDDLFESYLRAVLRSRLGSRGLRVLDGNRDGSKRLFDDAKEPQAHPDIVIEAKQTQRRIVADAKYKEKTDRGDLNQAITYAVSYRATDAILIHQCLPGKPIGRQRLGSINGMTLHSYGFDLASPDLDREEQALADSMAALFS